MDRDVKLKDILGCLKTNQSIRLYDGYFGESFIPTVEDLENYKEFYLIGIDWSLEGLNLTIQQEI